MAITTKKFYADSNFGYPGISKDSNNIYSPQSHNFIAGFYAFNAHRGVIKIDLSQLSRDETIRSVSLNLGTEGFFYSNFSGSITVKQTTGNNLGASKTCWDLWGNASALGSGTVPSEGSSVAIKNDNIKKSVAYRTSDVLYYVVINSNETSKGAKFSPSKCYLEIEYGTEDPKYDDTFEVQSSASYPDKIAIKVKSNYMVDQVLDVNGKVVKEFNYSSGFKQGQAPVVRENFITNLPDGTSYSYKLRGYYNVSGNPKYSNTIAKTYATSKHTQKAAITNLKCKRNGTSVTLTWDSTRANYCEVLDANNAVVAKIGFGVKTYTIANLPGGREYVYKVRGFNNGTGNGDAVSVTIPDGNIFYVPFTEYSLGYNGGVYKIDLFSRDYNNNPVEFYVDKLEEQVTAPNGTTLGGHFVEHAWVEWNSDKQYLYIDYLRSDSYSDKWNYIYLKQKGTNKTIRIFLGHHCVLTMDRSNLIVNDLKAPMTGPDYTQKFRVNMRHPSYIHTLESYIMPNGTSYPSEFTMEKPFQKEGSVAVKSIKHLRDGIWEIEVYPTAWTKRESVDGKPAGYYNTNLIIMYLDKNTSSEAGFMIRYSGYVPL